MTVDVSVIIVNYNTKQLLKNCLLSIIDHTQDISYEVIVVDNASFDGSQNMIKSEFPEVHLIESDCNLGFGRANNLGSRQAMGKYLFYLNSDTILLNNAIKHFFDFAENVNYPLGALGCILLGSDNQPCHSYGDMITIKTELRASLARYVRFLKKTWLTHPSIVTSPIPVDYITGADLFVPKNIFVLTGGFDEDYFMYCEEVDWQKRMQDFGLRRVIIPTPKIIHLEGGSDSKNNKGWSISRINNIQRSRRIFYKKHFNKWLLPIFLLCQWCLQLPWKILIKLKENN